MMPFGRETGDYVSCTVQAETFRAFVPRPLPPTPALALDSAICELLDRADRALSRLDGLTAFYPDTHLLVHILARKEAVSSQFGRPPTLIERLLLFESQEAPDIPFDDVRAVSDYLRALLYGVERIRSMGGSPPSLQLIKELHEIILAGEAGGNKRPGQFRQGQNWLGGTKVSNALFVGPPPDQLVECLDSFEKFLHDCFGRMPILMKAALAHVQFESIHPFNDGNGRLGRLLMTLLLCSEMALREPVLYLSVYFKANLTEYYVRIQDVRDKGDWEGWLRFFLTAVLETSDQAVNVVKSIRRLFGDDRRRIASLGRAANSALRVHEILRIKPLISIGGIARSVNLSEPEIQNSVEQLQAMGILREITVEDQYRLFVYDRYLRILEEGPNEHVPNVDPHSIGRFNNTARRDPSRIVAGEADSVYPQPPR